MKLFASVIFILAIVAFQGCNSHQDNKAGKVVTFSLNHSIDSNKISVNLLKDIENFLLTKNSNYTENAYWALKDFETYIYPFYDIIKIWRKDSKDSLKLLRSILVPSGFYVPPNHRPDSIYLHVLKVNCHHTPSRGKPTFLSSSASFMHDVSGFTYAQ